MGRQEDDDPFSFSGTYPNLEAELKKGRTRLHEDDWEFFKRVLLETGRAVVRLERDLSSVRIELAKKAGNEAYTQLNERLSEIERIMKGRQDRLKWVSDLAKIIAGGAAVWLLNQLAHAHLFR